jgi:hypothetical protein
MSTPTVGRRALDTHEAIYLANVKHFLRDLPGEVRAELVDATRDHLAERPTVDADELSEAFGSPDQYARALREQHGYAPERARIRVPWRRVVIGAVVVALVLSGIAVGRWWVNWSAHVEAPGFGLRYLDDRPFDGITESSTAASSQRTVAWSAGRRLELRLVMTAGRDIEITKVGLPMSPASLLSPVSVLPAPPFPMNERTGTSVHLTYRFTGCEKWQPGDQMFWDHVRVDYRALGRTRHADVPLTTILAVTSPPDSACPGRHLPGSS